jgi:hypothetical protein
MPTILQSFLAISLTVLAASPALSATCGPPPFGWGTTRPDATIIKNTVTIPARSGPARAVQASPTWNGSPVTPQQVREYVELTKSIPPVPTLLLVVSPAADCAEINMFRQMVNEILDCELGQCVEVSL